VRGDFSKLELEAHDFNQYVKSFKKAYAKEFKNKK
jgi:hypothetical protein